MAENSWEPIFQTFLETDQTRKLIETALKNFFEYKIHGRTNEKSDRLIDTCSINVDGVLFYSKCLAITPRLERSPEEVLKRCDELLNNFKCNFQSQFPKQDLPLMRFRLNALPPLQRFQRIRMPKGYDVGKIIQLSGTVVKITSPRVLSTGKAYLCGACKSTSISKADPSQFNYIPFPAKCPNCKVKGQMKSEGKDDGTDLCMAKDMQEIKIQEKMSNLKIGSVPKAIWITVEDDLVGRCKPGDDIQVIGIVFRRWQTLGKLPGGKTEIKVAINANHIEVMNEQQNNLRLTEDQIIAIEKFWKDHRHNELEARNHIIASFCPQIYGLYPIKLAVCLVLCGGIERKDPNGTRNRGDSHILLVGDPGTGKSQILRYAAKLTPKSVMTSGIGSTNAGLTVSAMKDGSQWVLESGALVLADGGVCCIDEFGTIKEADRVAIHEAMEQQSISVAKGGMVTRLKTRCSVVASANPKGRYDPEFNMTVNIGIGSPLLSRFDLVFLLLDSKNPDWDIVVSTYILSEKDPSKDSSEPLWNFEKLKYYFAYCRQLEPKMTKDASEVLSRYYTAQRQRAIAANMSRRTARFLQSCIRIAEGHARLMNHEEVTISDAINAIFLFELTYQSTPLYLPEDANPLHTTFPIDPLKEYEAQADIVLNGLGLPHLWDKEFERLSKLPKKTAILNPSLPMRPPEQIIEEHHAHMERRASDCRPSSQHDDIKERCSRKRRRSTSRDSNSNASTIVSNFFAGDDEPTENAINVSSNTNAAQIRSLQEFVLKEEERSYEEDKNESPLHSTLISDDSPSPKSKLSTRDKLKAFAAPAKTPDCSPSPQRKFKFKKIESS